MSFVKRASPPANQPLSDIPGLLSSVWYAFLQRLLATDIDGTVLITQEPVHLVGETGEPAFQNGWGNWPAVTTIGFWKDSCGVIHLQGTAVGGSPLDTIFTLPAGYRPLLPVAFPVAVGAADVGFMLIVDDDGDIIPWADGAFVVLDGMTFRAK